MTAVVAVGHSPQHAPLLKATLADTHARLFIAHSPIEARAQLAQSAEAILLIAAPLALADSAALLREFSATPRNCVVIVTSTQETSSEAVAALRHGAFDYVAFPQDRKALLAALSRAGKFLGQPCPSQSAANSRLFIGSSEAMREVERTAHALRNTRANVLVWGESGTGKSFCARVVHKISTSPGTFVSLLAADLPVEGGLAKVMPQALDDTSSAATHTLFIDQLTNLGADAQAQLLGWLTTAEQAGFRVIASTTQDPESLFEGGAVHPSILSRLTGVVIHLPPLRERGDDVIELAEHILLRLSLEHRRSFQAISERVRALLAAYPWPGNIRQLENILWQSVLLHDAPVLSEDMLPPHFLKAARATNTGARQGDAFAGQTLAMIERAAIEAAIARNGGSVPRAARELDVSPSTLYRKFASWRSGQQ